MRWALPIIYGHPSILAKGLAQNRHVVKHLDVLAHACFRSCLADVTAGEEDLIESNQIILSIDWTSLQIDYAFLACAMSGNLDAGRHFIFSTDADGIVALDDEGNPHAC